MNFLGKRFRGSGSIRRRLFWILGGLVLGILLIINLIWLSSAIVEIEDSQSDLRRVAVHGLRDQIGLFLEEKEQGLRSESQLFSLSFLEGDRKELIRLAYRLLKRELAIEEIGILDEKGQERFRLSRRAAITELDLRDLSASPLFREGMRQDIYWEAVLITATSEPWVTLAVPLRRSETATVGLLYGVLNLKSLWSLIGEFQLRHLGRAYVVDQTGRLIAADDPSLVLRQLSFADRPIVRELTLSSSATEHSFVQGAYTNENNVKVMASGFSISGPRWAVVVEQPQRILYAPIKRKLWFFAGVFSIGLIVSFSLAHLLSRRFTIPVLRLREGVEQVARGNLEHKVVVETTDEIGELASKFNQMADQLRASQENLEGKVKEKTRDLSSLYSVLAPLAPADSVEQMLTRVIERVMVATGADAGLIRIMDKTTGAFVYPAQIGFSSNYLEDTQRLREGSAVALAFRTGEPVIAANIADDLRLKGKRQVEAGLKSSAFLPLKVAGELRGVIHLASRELGHFNEKKKDHLMTIARQMGVAMENRELFQETERRAQEQTTLSAIAKASGQSLDLKELFGIVLDKTVEVTGRGRVNIRLKDPLTGKVTIVAHRGFTKEEIEELRRRTPHPAGEQVFASGEPLIINDTRGYGSPDLLQLTRSVAWIPIKAGTRVVGVLGISNSQLKPFSPSEVDLLQAIGSVIGVAIENARLFEETKRNLVRIRALHEIDVAITSSLDLRTVLDLLLEKIDSLVLNSVATVRLLNRETGELECVACRNLDEKEWKEATAGIRDDLARMLPENIAPVIIRNAQTDSRLLSREFLRKQGLVSYLRVPLAAQGKVLGVLAVFTREEHEFTNEEVEFFSTLAGQAAIAIHNSQLYEEMVKLAADLSRSNRVKDEFLSVMSHELRTPLNVVMGYTGMIKDRLLGEINPEQEKALEKVISHARDQLSMISSILQATQLEAEGVKVESQKFSLGDFLDDLRSAYDVPLDKKLTLNWDYGSDLPIVKTDGEKLLHILKNLIDNAIKFTEKGHVTISARIKEGTRQKAEGSTQRIEFLPIADRLLPTGEGKWVEFKVADTGLGIPKQALPLIFEMFRQVDSSETRAYGGVGLGLYIVKKLTRLLEGTVEVESELGKGSTFTVIIPLRSAH